MEENIDYIETRPQPKIALLSFGEYFKLNHDISTARGWYLGGDTERTFTMNPRAAKTEIEYDQEGNIANFVPKLVMPLSSEIQESHADLLEGIELHDSYVPVDNQVEEFFADIIDVEVVDWTIQHFVRVQGIGEQLTIYVSQQIIDMLTDEHKAILEGYGLNVQLAE